MKFVYLAFAAILCLIGCAPAHAGWTVDPTKSENILITESICGYYSGGIAALVDRAVNYGDDAEATRESALRGVSNTMSTTDMYVAWVMIVPEAKFIAPLAKDKDIVTNAREEGKTLADSIQQLAKVNCHNNHLGKTYSVPLRVYVKDGLKM